MSFHRTPEKKKKLAVFERALAEVGSSDLSTKIDKDSIERKDEEARDKGKLDSSLKQCKSYYEKAESNAIKEDYAGSLRQFDLSLRFWGIHLQILESMLKNAVEKMGQIDMNETNERTKEMENENEKEIIEWTKSEEYAMEVDTFEKQIKEHKELGAKIFEAQSQVLLEMERDFDAIAHCKEAIACNPNWSIAYLTLSRAEMNFGDAFTALETAKTAFQLDSTNPEIVQHLDFVQQIVTKMNQTIRTHGLSENRKCMRMMRVDDDLSNEKNPSFQLIKNDCEKVKKRLKERELNTMLNEIGGKLERLSLDPKKQDNSSNHVSHTTRLITDSSHTKRFGVLEDST